MGIKLSELLDVELALPKARTPAGLTKVGRLWTRLDDDQRDLALRILREIARG